MFTGPAYGYNAEMLLEYKDKDDNGPLHAAVMGGTLQAVHICLEYNAAIDIQQVRKGHYRMYTSV